MWWKINCILLGSLFAVACESSPPLEKRGYEPDAVSIAYLKSQYPGVPKRIRGEMYIEGRIVANDRWGNFYKTLVVQDETGAIEVKLDAEELFFVCYGYGEMVRINCNGLAVGAYGGNVQLGAVSDDTAYETGYVAMNRIAMTVQVLDGMAEEPVPIPLTLVHLNNPQFDIGRYLNCLVVVSDVQFVDYGEVVSWAEGESGATDRLITDMHGNTLVVRTSALASFAEEPLPAGSGSIKGILGWFNGTPQLKVYDPREVDMNGARF